MRPTPATLRALLTLTAGALLAYFSATPLLADYNSSNIRTVEWLVDRSDVIAVLAADEKGGDKAERVVHAFKGDAGRMVMPLIEVREDNAVYYGPNGSGAARLVFVRGESGLLQAVELARRVPGDFVPDLRDVWFGVDQYGELLLSEASLLKAVAARVEAGPGEPLPMDRRTKTNQRLGAAHPWGGAAIAAPADFALETTNETYRLVVPFTVERREHFQQVLQTGTAPARIRAIAELSLFDDKAAADAIRNATKAKDVVPAFRPGMWEGSGRSDIWVTAEDVRKVAQDSLMPRSPE